MIFCLLISLNIIGFDAGGTFLKYGSPQNLNLLPNPYTKDIIFDLMTSDKKEILLTGAGAKTIASWISHDKTVSQEKNRPGLHIYNEFQCTGLGGAKLAKQEECLVVNIGSGTPILYANARDNVVKHLGGTGLGSATLVGLSHFILQISDLSKISELALLGDPSNVNLLVSDLYERSTEDLGLPGDITASNFGKYQDWRHVRQPTKNDILAGLHVLVAETIAGLSNQATQAYNSSDLPIVLTGGGTLNGALVKYLQKTFQYLQKTVIVPENAIYGTLTGLFALFDQHNNT